MKDKILLINDLAGYGKVALADSTKKAMDVVKNLILLNRDNGDKVKGIPVEQYLDVLD